MRKFILPVLVLLTAASCDKEYVYDGPCGVNSHLYEFKAAGEESLILVYSTEKWTVRLIDDVPWASVSDVDGGKTPGAGAFKFSCEKNTSVTRQARVVVYFPEKRDTIFMRQAGVDIVFSFETSSLQLPATAGHCEVALTTNLQPEHISDIIVSMTYKPSYEDWISNISISEDKVSFDYGRLILPEERTASLWFRYTDVAGKRLVDCPLNITQK